MATALNDSQNPGTIVAQGSNKTTQNNAHANTTAGDERCPLQIANATTVSIQIARCAGIAKPDNIAYNSAINQPANTAARCAGNRNVRNELRRHNQKINPYTRLEIMVICSPEIAIK